IEMPAIQVGNMAICFSKPKDSTKFDFSRSGSKTSLLIVKVQNAMNMYAMTIVADSSYLKGNYNKLANNTYQKIDTNFTGTVFFNQMDGTFVNGWIYKSGVITRQLSPSTSSNSQAIQSLNSGKLHVDEEEPGCGAIVSVTVYEDCYTYPSGSSICYITNDTNVEEDCPPSSGGTGGTTGGGGGGASPCTVPPANSSVQPVVINSSSPRGFTVNVAMPPPGGGSTTTCTTTVLDTTKNPCAQIAAATARAANAIIEAQNQTILNNTTSTGTEYGTNENLTSLTSNTYENTPVTTNGGTSAWQPTFTWDSTNGYTVGFSHGHPGGTGPSPADVFTLVTQIGHMPLRGAGTVAIQYYENHASVTTLTATGTYIVAVSNWTVIQNLYSSSYSTQTEQDNFKAAYQTQGANYLADNPNATAGDAGAYALIKMFPGSINIYYASPGSTTYIPMTINNTILVKVPCPDI
ncbi:MAG: hypothetical protein JST50_03100, partial [Bacteroidetes bacterium]|nr:hypothetical protein [Bacteroidota bacterium]